MYRTRIKGSVVGCLFGFIVRYEVIVICISDGVIWRKGGFSLNIFEHLENIV